MAQPLATLYAHSLGWHGLLWCKHQAEIYTLKAEMALSVHFYHRINYNLQTSSGKHPFDSSKNPEDKIRWNSREVGHGGLANKGDLHAMLVASVHTAELLTVTLCTKPAQQSTEPGTHDSHSWVWTFHNTTGFIHTCQPECPGVTFVLVFLGAASMHFWQQQ